MPISATMTSEPLRPGNPVGTDLPEEARSCGGPPGRTPGRYGRIADAEPALQESKKELNRAQLTQWLPDYFTDRADEILEHAATDFTSVTFDHLGAATLTVPVRQREEPPLERTMSMKDLNKYKAAATEGGKRSFFRTWVRAVPRERFG